MLQANSVQKILVACPNCQRIFSEYGKTFEVKTVYEELAETANFSSELQREVTVHGSCGDRFAKNVQASSRKLVERMGPSVLEMPHSGIQFE